MNALLEKPRAAAAGQRRFAGDSARWQAIVRRDSQADGHFYYSVKTTGVYCRPSCASRQPRRENVRFHDTCGDAERAGFRPCKRCQPGGPTLSEQHAAAVAAACRVIESSGKLPDLDTLAKSAAMSRFHFHRVFKRLTGLTPKAFAAARRSQRLRDVLPRRGTVTEAIYESGFNSNSRFYSHSGRLLGMKPSTYRKGGAGTTIRYAIGQCSLGPLLVAASERGVCAISLGEKPGALLQDLQRRFPKARVLEADRDFERTVAQVVAFVETPVLGLDLPLDLQGTAFQQRVWQALLKIPLGSTASYAEIARRIGSPNSVRAVGQACGSNPIALAVPCHRVVRSDGELSGYRWGSERKRALLKREQAQREKSAGS